MSESHFAESERAVMKTVIQDCLLNDADLDKYGKETLRAFSAVVDVDVEKRIQERITMYAHKVADRVFLLDVLQQSRARLQAGVPGMCCWLRTPLTRLSDPSAVLIVKKDGDIGYCTASSAHVGVRPAFYLDQAAVLPCKPQVRILGVGTAGIRILNRMIDDCGDSGEYLAIDQDPSALENSRTKNRIWARERRRIGLGSDPLSVPESIADVAGEITESVRGARLVVLTGGLGRVFGTNALPMIAQIVKDTNREGVVAAIVTKPFHFEKHSVRIAEEGARRLLPCVDCLILIQDDDLLEEMDRKHTTLSEAFKIADQTVVRAIRCVADAVSRSGIVSPDPSEIFEILRHAGTAEFGTGAAGVGRPIDEAIQNVFCSRPLGISDHPADKVLLRLSCSDGISFQELAGALESAQRTLGNRTEFYCSVHIGEIPYGFTEASAVAFWD